MKEIPKKLAISMLTAAVALTAVPLDAEAEELKDVNESDLCIYVSTTGDDSADGSKEHPFQTIERAQQEVRAKNDDMDRDIRVIIHEGTYFMDETLEFTSEDSATNGYRISYESAPNEEVVISGGQKITGQWEDTGNGIYKTNVGDVRFRQLYTDGDKAYRATTRDITSDMLDDSNYFRAYWNRDADRYKLKVNKADFDLSALSAEELSQTEAIIIQHWSESYVRFDEIVSSDDEINLVSIQQEEHDILSNRGYSILRDGDPYYLENALAFVDQGGEWFLDNNSGDLYYKVKENQDINDIEFTAPVTETLWRVEGTYDNPIENMEVHGLKFAYTTWMRASEHGCINAQAGLYNIKTVLPNDQWIGRPPAGVEVSATRNFVFERNTLYNMGSTGIDLHLGTQNSEIVGNVIRDMSGNGIMIAEFAREDVEFHEPYVPLDPREVCKDDRIANNYITNIGTDYLGTTAIAAGYPQGVVIEHNEIHNTPYTGITLGYGWLTDKTPMEYNIVRYNEIYDVVRLMSDGGAIYTLSYQPGSQITKNYIHDLNHNAATQPAPVCAIFLDEGSSGFTVKDNVIQNMGENTRRIFRNANSNPITDNTEPIADVIQNAGLEAEYKDIKLSEKTEKPVITKISETIKVNEPVTLQGEYFGETKGSVHVAGDGLDFEVTSDQITSWNDNEIVFIMPSDVSLEKAVIFVENSGGYSNEVEVAVELDGPLDISEDFEQYEEGTLPQNAVWASGKDAAVISNEDGKVLELSAAGANAKAVMARSADNYTLTFDILVKTEPENAGDGLYMQFKDGMRLEWISHDTEDTFSFSRNGNRVAGCDYAPVTDQWHTIKMQVDGENLKAKIWSKAEEEPQDWMVETTYEGVSVPIAFEYYHLSGKMQLDNIVLQEQTEGSEDNKGKEQSISFDDYEEGALQPSDVFGEVNNAEIAAEDGNKVLRLNGLKENAIATLNGEYRNYDLQMDIRFDTQMRENQSEGLYFLVKENGGFVRIEYLPEWKNIYTIKYGQSQILDTTNDIETEYNTWYTLKVSVKGNQYLSKVWKKGETEPEDWLITGNNSDPATGRISLQYYADNGSMSVDNIEITNVNFDEIDTTRKITGIEQVEDKNVWIGTSAYSLQLPEYLKLEVDGEMTDETARVAWQYQTYKSQTAGDQVIEGILKPEYDLKNPEGLIPQVKVTVIDNAELKALAAEAESKVEKAYTEESYQALRTALDEANALLAGEPVSNENVTEKANALRQAIDNLVLSENMETLKALLDESRQLLDTAKDVLYEDAESAYEGEYAKADYDVLQETRIQTEATYNELLSNTDLTDEEFAEKLNGAVTNLTEDMEALRKSQITVDRTVLEQLIEAAKAVDPDQYTEESYAELEKAVQTAEEVLGGKVNQKMIDDQITALETALEQLELKEQPTDPEDPDQPTDLEDPDQPTDPEKPGQPTDPNQPDKPQNPDGTGSGGQGSEDNTPAVQTGDNTPITLAVAAVILSLGAIGVTGYLRKKKR